MKAKSLNVSGHISNPFSWRHTSWKSCPLAPVWTGWSSGQHHSGHLWVRGSAFATNLGFSVHLPWAGSLASWSFHNLFSWFALLSCWSTDWRKLQGQPFEISFTWQYSYSVLKLEYVSGYRILDWESFFLRILNVLFSFIFNFQW